MTDHAVTMNPIAIIKRLGVDAVLLPIRAGTKAPSRRRWEQTTYLATQHPVYQDALATTPAIGVLLGAVSQGLCSIDFDDEIALEEFLAANPLLQGSLRTKGRRGANVWVVIEGTIPRSRKLKSGAQHIGEWRAAGNHTIIAGQHPDGGEYSWIVDAEPKRLPYADLVWPWEDVVDASSSPPPPSSKSSISLHTLNNLHPLHNTRDKVEAVEKARNEMKPGIKRLYALFIEKRFSPVQGTRNSDLIAMVTFLFRAVGQDQLRTLVQAFYDLNQDLFLDPRKQHLAEAEAHLEACRRTWLGELSEDEKVFIATLPDTHVDAFRICRDLALFEKAECPPPNFFISCNNLGDRLGVAPMQAQRILRVMESHGCLEITRKGIPRKKGQRGKVTFFRWLPAIGIVVLILLISFRPITYPFPNSKPWEMFWMNT